MDAEPSRLREELSRATAHRCALEEALAAAETERARLLSEERKLRAQARRMQANLRAQAARIADLAGALNVARAGQAQPQAAPRPRPEPPTAAQAGAASAAAGQQPEPEPAAVRPLRALPSVPAIEVRDLCKSYRIPTRPVDTLKERMLHPLRSRGATTLEALRGVSFDVARGEFLGIAGANGSGKSTLLKLLANVYAADSGRIRTAGRVAPFIELGVGLNPEFAAYDNVVISGVMMGLEPEEARRRYPDVIEFAGLEDFTEVKLKNYSSGMRVRLAFAVMAQVDADILLIDEVLAVGDAEFRSKCLERIRQLRERGATIVLVTHGMETMAAECDRAILLRDGEIHAEGDPREVARIHTEEQKRGAAPAAERAAEAVQR